MINAETYAMIRQIGPSSDIKFLCGTKSFIKTPGEIVSFVMTDMMELQMVCYNQAEDAVTTIHNYGNYAN